MRLKALRRALRSGINAPAFCHCSASAATPSLPSRTTPRSSSIGSRPFLLMYRQCAAMAPMPRQPPVTLTITCGAPRTTVACRRCRMARARPRKTELLSTAPGERTMRLPG
jgi:hypothetical protein